MATDKKVKEYIKCRIKFHREEIKRYKGWLKSIEKNEEGSQKIKK